MSGVAVRESVRHCAHPGPASPRTNPFVYPRRKAESRRSCLETTLDFYPLEVRSACPSTARTAALHQISAPQTGNRAPGSRRSVPCPERPIASPARQVFTAAGSSRPKSLPPSLCRRPSDSSPQVPSTDLSLISCSSLPEGQRLIFHTRLQRCRIHEPRLREILQLSNRGGADADRSHTPISVTEVKHSAWSPLITTGSTEEGPCEA